MTTQGEKTAVSPGTLKSTPAPPTTNYPLPHYFISRNDGSITPLIAVDELPVSIRIVGVPATISPAETVNMISLGVKDRSTHKYIVETSDSTIDSNPVKPIPQHNTVEGNSGTLETPLQDSSNTIGSNSGILENPPQDPIAVASQGPSGVAQDARGEIENASETVKGPSNLVPEEKVDSGGKNVEEWRQGVNEDGIQATIDTITNQNVTDMPASITQDATTPGSLGKKVYCTHWIRWGECDYTQQGCLYKHEMPDEPTLNSIGIRTIPKWYRDINAPKTGWTGRPAPSDQLWRGKPSRSAQPPNPVPLFVPSRPATVSLHDTVRVSHPNAPSTYQPRVSRGSNAFGSGQNNVEQHRPAAYQPRVSLGFSPFGNAPNLMDQRPPASYPPHVSLGSMNFSNDQNTMDQRDSFPHGVTAHNQSNFGPSSPLTTTQPFFNPEPRRNRYTAPHNPTRDHDLYNLPPALAPSYRPLQPSVSPVTTVTPSMPVPPSSSATQTTYFEPQTPAPQHRRMFVPAGEALYVTNAIPKNEVRGNTKVGKRYVKGRKVGTGNSNAENGNGQNSNGGDGNGNGNSNGGNANVLRDLLVDFE